MDRSSSSFDPERSLAILFGVFEYRAFDTNDPPLDSLKPHVENNLDALTQLFHDPFVLGFKHVDPLRNPSRNRIFYTLERHANTTFYDTVLVYYSGHGIPKAGRYFLTGSDSCEKAESTCIEFHRELLPLLGRFKADRLILIVDACFSERAIQRRSETGPREISESECSSPQSTSNEKPASPQSNIYMIVSSGRNEVSDAESDKVTYTGFGAMLVDTLRSGIESIEEEYITFPELIEHIHTIAPSRDLPVPPVPPTPSRDIQDFREIANRSNGSPLVTSGDSSPDVPPPPPWKLWLHFNFRGYGSFGEAFLGLFTDTRPIVLWTIPIIAALILIYSSTFVGIDDITIPPQSPSVGNEMGEVSRKQVGLWGSLNWSGVYLVLFPVFLVLVGSFASQVRRLTDTLLERGLLLDSFGHLPDRSEVHELINAHVRGLSLVLLGLLVAVLTLTIGGWIITSGPALLGYGIGKEVIDWSTALIGQGSKITRVAAAFYTFIAMCWMGFALFTYYACLFLMFQLVAHLASVTDAGGNASKAGRGLRVIWQADVFQDNLPTLYRVCGGAIVLGLMAGYLMRLQALYLVSGYVDVWSFWLGDIRHLLSAIGWIGDFQVPTTQFQPEGAKNPTYDLATAQILATLVTLLVITWMLYRFFENAKNYTVGKGASPTIANMRRINALTDETIDEVRQSSFWRDVLGEPWWIGVAVVSVVLATLLDVPGLLFLFAAVGALSCLVMKASVALVRRFGTRE